MASALDSVALGPIAAPLILEVSSTENARGATFQALPGAAAFAPTERYYSAKRGGDSRSVVAAGSGFDASAYDVALLNITLGRDDHLRRIIESSSIDKPGPKEFVTDDTDSIFDLATDIGQDLSEPVANQNL